MLELAFQAEASRQSRRVSLKCVGNFGAAPGGACVMPVRFAEIARNAGHTEVALLSETRIDSD